MYSAEHRPYAALAYIVLVVSTLISLLLFFYPFKFFQRILNCFSCCPSLVLAIHTFADVFQCCFKNGQNGVPDRRYFAGLYLLFRFIATFSSCTSFYALYSESFAQLGFVYVILVVLLFILQPYRQHFYNCLDGVFSIILTIHSVFAHSYFSDFSILQNWSITTRKEFYFIFGVLFVPLAYFICFMCYWIIIHLRCIKRAVPYLRARLSPNKELTPLLDSQQEPDRLENPERYEEETGVTRSTQDWESFTDSNRPTY